MMAFNYNFIKSNIRMIHNLQTRRTLLQSNNWDDLLKLEIISLVNTCVPFIDNAISHQMITDLTNIDGHNVIFEQIYIRLNKIGGFKMPQCQLFIRVNGEPHVYTLILSGDTYNIRYNNTNNMKITKYNNVQNIKARKMIIFG